MKFKKRKIKYAAIFFICWFAFLVFLIDGVLKIGHSTNMGCLQIHKRKIKNYDHTRIS